MLNPDELLCQVTEVVESTDFEAIVVALASDIFHALNPLAQSARDSHEEILIL